MRTLWICGVALCALSVSAATPSTAKDSTPPAPVGKEILRFLEGRINLAVSDMAPALALEWQMKLVDIPLNVEGTEKANAKKVSFNLTDVTLAEALRVVSEKTGAKYRIVGNSIRLALPEEWKEVDAGTKRFEELKAKAPAK